MKTLPLLIAAGSLLLCLPLAQAQTLKIPLGQQAAGQHDSLPAHGNSRSLVLQRYGEPRTRHPAVGQPPISRWDYATFSVYFEYDHVVHSVRHHHPQAGSQ